MKVSPSVSFVIPKKNQTTPTFQPPAIPLRKVPLDTAEPGDIVQVKLRSTPTDAASQQYTLKVRVFGSGSVESYLDWEEAFDKAVKGQNITTGPPMYAMAKRLLEGDALTEMT